MKCGMVYLRMFIVNEDDKKVGTMNLLGCRCQCGHEWLPRGDDDRIKPRRCPKCKNKKWDTLKAEQCPVKQRRRGPRPAGPAGEAGAAKQTTSR